MPSIVENYSLARVCMPSSGREAAWVPVRHRLCSTGLRRILPQEASPALLSGPRKGKLSSLQPEGGFSTCNSGRFSFKPVYKVTMACYLQGVIPKVYPALQGSVSKPAHRDVVGEIWLRHLAILFIAAHENHDSNRCWPSISRANSFRVPSWENKTSNHCT